MLNRRGQNTAEYAILIALVVAAAVAMQTYVKRSVQGGVKYTVDKLQRVDAAGNKGLQQYEPEYLSSQYTGTQKAYQETEETKLGGGTERTFAGEGGAGSKVSTREGYQKTAAPK
ncbi:MAG: hypothetical protein Q8R31_04040 [Candidatus Omnitrophota bacterium]|nr:hypothetical protein [Candidatus Omnitrophota bacterium]